MNAILTRYRGLIRLPVSLAAWGGCLVLVLSSGCSPRETSPPGEAEREVRTEDLSWGAVEFLVDIQPATVRMDADVELAMRLTAPSEMDVGFPALEGRVAGFTVDGVIGGEPVTRDGKTVRTQRVRLRPTVQEEHRIAPLAVEFRQHGKDGWYATPAIEFEVAAPAPGSDAKDVRGSLEPRWIPPSAWTVVGWALGVPALLAMLAWGGWLAFKHLRRARQLRRMSPRERALLELTELLSKDLIAQERFADFYVELTMVVRRYIERMHGIRAPEQTTEEFLQAVSRDSRFSAAVLARLRDFLQAADLVKFAAFRPGSDSVDQAVATAREYVAHDEASSNPQPNAGEGN